MAESVDAVRFEQLYRHCLLWPLDYVMLEVAKAGRRIKLRAGVLGSAPVYCLATGKRAIVSWDFADFLVHRPPIDIEVASHRLALNTAYSARQICVGVTLLTERATLCLEPDNAHYQYPPAVEMPTPTHLPMGVDATTAFGELLRHIIAMRPITPNQIAAELSGGMDSAAVACALATEYGPIASQGILLHGDCRHMQIERRNKIVNQLGLHDETVDIAAFPPSLDLRPASRKEYVHTEYYLEAIEALWSVAHSQGRDTIFTGFGGDELFMPFFSGERRYEAEDDSETTKSRRYAERLLTPYALSAARSMCAFNAPISPVPAVRVGTCQAQHLMKFGLWPVNPLSDPNLVALCYRLPQEHRHGRETMRRYLQNHLGEEVFPHNYTKETFAQVFPELIAKQRENIAAQLQECALADLGLVDQRSALALLDEVATTREEASISPLVNFLWLERFVRQVH